MTPSPVQSANQRPAKRLGLEHSRLLGELAGHEGRHSNPRGECLWPHLSVPCELPGHEEPPDVGRQCGQKPEGGLSLGQDSGESGQGQAQVASAEPISELEDRPDPGGENHGLDVLGLHGSSLAHVQGEALEGVLQSREIRAHRFSQDLACLAGDADAPIPGSTRDPAGEVAFRHLPCLVEVAPPLSLGVEPKAPVDLVRHQNKTGRGRGVL